MKMKNHIIICFVLLCGCSQTTKEVETITKDLRQIKQLDFFLGDWQNISGNGKFYESWKKINDTLYSGNSFMIIGDDTTFSEFITLELRNNELFYIPAVSSQNNNEAIAFKLVKNTNNEFVFENKAHDFPQRIIYTKTVSDSLIARIEGNVDGKAMRQDFPMGKKNF